MLEIAHAYEATPSRYQLRDLSKYFQAAISNLALSVFSIRLEKNSGEGKAEFTIPGQLVGYPTQREGKRGDRALKRRERERERRKNCT